MKNPQGGGGDKRPKPDEIYKYIVPIFGRYLPCNNISKIRFSRVQQTRNLHDHDVPTLTLEHFYDNLLKKES